MTHKKHKHTELTEEQIDSIVETLGESRENIESIKKSVSDGGTVNTVTNGLVNTLANPPKQDTKVVTVNSNTGEYDLNSSEENDYVVQVSEEVQAETDKYVEDQLNSLRLEDAKKIIDGYDLSEEDAMKLSTLAIRYMKGEKFSAYNELPDSAKNIIKNMCSGISPQERSMTAKAFLQMIVDDMKTDKLYSSLQETINTELGKTERIMEEYNDQLKETMENGLLEKAAKLEKEIPNMKEESKEKAQAKVELLRNISETYTDTYTFKTLIDAVVTGKVRRLDKKVKHLKSEITSFNFKYKNSAYDIHDLSLVTPVLMRRVGLDVDEVQLFLALFCEVTKNMSSSNTVEHTFMYYTIRNILALDYSDNGTGEFRTQLIDNIRKLMEIIKA